MRSDDRSWPIRLADLNKCYDSCNYNLNKKKNMLEKLLSLYAIEIKLAHVSKQ